MNSLFNMDLMLYLTGIIMLLVAWMTWRDQAHPKRWTSALFWLLFASTFLFSDVLFWLVGKSLTYRIYGVIVVLLALIAGLGGLGSGSHLVTAAGKMSAGITQASRIGRKIFLPALLIPLITVFLSLAAKDWHVGHWFLLDQKNLTLASLLLACLTALLAACWLTRDTPLQAVRESRRLIDAIGWALILPAIAGHARRCVCRRTNRPGDTVAGQPVVSPGKSAQYRTGVLFRDDIADHDHGKRVCCVSRHDCGRCAAFADSCPACQSGAGGGNRDVFRLLRYADDAHGSQFQYRTGSLAGAER